MTIFTVGHSTRSLEELVALLRAHGVVELVDVRRHPGSRRHPHFAKDALARSLPQEGIGYRHAPELGGRRKGRPDSANDSWRDPSFRAYADYQQSHEFQRALEELVAGASVVTAVMCAEALPWRCHRQIIADTLVARGIEVRHILSLERADVHALNPRARKQENGTLVYPATDQLELL